MFTDKFDATFEDRLKSKIRKNENDCWIWAGSLNKGYGQIYFQGKLAKAHRATYWHFKGPFNTKKHIHHKCNNPKCVNPEHLEPLTASENNKERDPGIVGRKRIGQPISLTVTPEQREYLDSLIQPGGTRTEAIRRIIQQAMDQHDERKVS